MSGYVLLGTRGAGSAVVEAALTLAGLPFLPEDVDYAAPGPGRDRLRALNPLGQVPTLVLPDGSVMTESAAMILHIDDRAPAAGLVPRPGEPERPAFLRWLLLLFAGLYPTFTYGDDPARWVPAEAAPALRASTDATRERLWRQLEDAIRPAPWFLGGRFSALDLYVTVMTRWRPRRAWFAAHAPRLSAVAAAGDGLAPLAPVWRRHFGAAAAGA